MSQAKTNPVPPHGDQQQPQRRPSSLNKPLLPRSSGDSRDYGSSSGGGGTQIHYNPPDTVTWSGPGATNQGHAPATNQLSGSGSHGVSMNKYATKKTYSQGLFTLALFINNVAALRAAIAQVWSLTQFHSVDFSKSRIDVKKCVFNERTIKFCISCA